MDAAENVSAHIAKAMSIGAKMWRMAEGISACEHFARPHHRRAPARASPAGEQKQPQGANAGAVMCCRNGQQRFAAWRAELIGSANPPYAAQWACLDSIHARCVLEFREEQFGGAQNSQEEPHRALVYGTPGHGKTQLFLWIRNYFEKVWGWEHGVPFVCLAPISTMAVLIKCFAI